MKKLFSYCAILILSLSMLSCLPLVDTPTNDNAELYGSEWSSDDQVESLMFNKDNSVVYRCQDRSGKGTFNYNKSEQYITFDDLTVVWPKTTSIMTSATLSDDKTMKLRWHEVGKTENYYQLMYRRR